MEVEQAAEPRTTSHPTRHRDQRRTRYQATVESLVISFALVVPAGWVNQQQR
jgi:hypothetical protein